MRRRRKPDSWTDVHPGDIVSFDTKSPRCPSGAYVRDIIRRDDGKHVISGTFGESIVEHGSYRMRLDNRSLTSLLQEEGVIDVAAGWRVRMTFDWCGRRPPVLCVEQIPLPEPVWLRWDVPGATYDEEGSLLLKLWGAPVESPAPGERYKPREHLMRLQEGELALIPRDHLVHDDDGAVGYATGDPSPWDGLFATPVRCFGAGDQPMPQARETLTAIANWVSANRADLCDPAQREHRA